MGLVLLDSSVLIDLLRSRPGARSHLESVFTSGDQPCTCAIVAEEVSVGLLPREREGASAMFEGLIEVPLGIAEGRLAGWWRASYRKRGSTLEQGDCLIAAAAVGAGAHLATGNPKDFPMKGLTVEHWPVNE
jgi:predicted nucleic acid-binding protein